MAREKSLKTLKRAAKLALLPAVVAVALALGTFSPQEADDAHAVPIGVTALNSTHCISLGVAFGGIPATTSALNCASFDLQPSFQTYMACLLKTIGVVCGNQPSPPIRPGPDSLDSVDLDANRTYGNQGVMIVAFVTADAPVRFTTDRGVFSSPIAAPSSADLYCNPGSPQYGAALDPDCDGDVNTVGDGVVVAKFFLGDDGDTGTINITVVQDGVGFPIQLTATGVPVEITLEPLFGKDTIQTGATRATPSTCPPNPPPGGNVYPIQCQLPDPTDCNFEASVAGVLGAVNQAEKTVVIAKAIDNNGEEVSGALLNWYKNSADLIDIGYPTLPDGTFGAADSLDPINGPGNGYRDQGGVALPQTPTLDTGTLGIGFPQFVCGGRDTGVIDLDVNFETLLTPGAPQSEHTPIQIDVVGHATDLTLVAEPAEIDCNGTNTSTVTATVVNAAGDPVANGLDINFSTVALGTANPLKVDSSDGVGATVITPLAGAADMDPRGVTVVVSVNGQVTETQEYYQDLPQPLTAQSEAIALQNPNLEPHQTFEVIERSILVACSGAVAPAPDTGAGTGAGTGAPTGTIQPPDTGSGGRAAVGMTWWSVAALAIAGTMLAAGTWATRTK